MRKATILFLLACGVILAGDKDITVSSGTTTLDYTTTFSSDSIVSWAVTDAGGATVLTYNDSGPDASTECDTSMFVVLYMCDCWEENITPARKVPTLKAACFDKKKEINKWLKGESPTFVLGVFKRDVALTLRKTVTEIEKLITEESVSWAVVE